MHSTQDAPLLAPRQREDLVVRHLPVARSLAARYSGRGIEVDDLRQAARMGLVKAARRYDPTQGAFLSYAVPMAKGEVRRCFRDLSRCVRPQLVENDEDGSLVEQVGELDPGFDDAEARVMVGAALQELDETELLVLRLRYAEGLTQSEIGERIGATQAQVSRTLARILRRMRVAVAA
ncbi:sigma-70 family RNA polymerase sigma factor [Nocardioides sp. KC13]|uniref:Sigma-70 family RNA polymerase sigma factor n=1 Tax=Nocardioides turkmenicus TaxID=2711220 RepID=A0A6M1QU80_9ACTN|nr:sigma-70 family RNA polymerase sigma factor [Nocardioides sp. KC13]NGN91376.1 sigma-70 family RNA polymerase sigma factor [Nocardioides sp. KC13]